MKKNIEYKTNLWMQSFIDVILLLVCLFVLIYASLNDQYFKGQSNNPDAHDTTYKNQTEEEKFLLNRSPIEVFQENFGTKRAYSKKYNIKNIFLVLQQSAMINYQNNYMLSLIYNEDKEEINININKEICSGKSIRSDMLDIIAEISKNIFHYTDTKIHVIYNAAIGYSKLNPDSLKELITSNTYCANLIKNEFIFSSLEQKLNMTINTYVNKNDNNNKFQIIIK